MESRKTPQKNSSKTQRPIKTPTPRGWFRTKNAAEYCDVSPRTVSSWLKQGLPHYRVNGCVLINRTELDQWLKKHSEINDLNAIAEQAVQGI